MGMLTDLPVETWEMLLRHLKGRHFVRVLLTGDTIVCRRMMAVRDRTFNAPSDLLLRRHEKVHRLTHLVVTLARTLKLRECQLLDLAAAKGQSPFGAIVRLEIRLPPVGAYKVLRFNDFTSMSCLQSLKIRHYIMTDPLQMPQSITSISASQFNCSRLEQALPIANMANLQNLVEMRLMTLTGMCFAFEPTTDWPPSLHSLDIPVGDNPHEILPRTLTRLTLSSGSVIDIYKLLTQACPVLTSLRVRQCAQISSPMPPGLEELTVLSLVELRGQQTSREIAQYLPSSLRKLHFTRTCHIGLREFAAKVLPGLAFADLDETCRALLRSHRGVDRLDDCIRPYLLPWLDNDESKVAAYIGAIESSGETRDTEHLPNAIYVEYLGALSSALDIDLCRRLFPLLMHGRVVSTRLPSSTTGVWPVSKGLLLLELGVIDSLCLFNESPPTLKLSQTQIDNLFELRVSSRHQGPLLLVELFIYNRLSRLKRIVIHSYDDLTVLSFVMAIERHQSNLPNLRSVQFKHEQPIDASKPAVQQAISKLAQMKLYASNQSRDDFFFVYRVSPPRPKESVE
jgi:hypothetical protein